MTERRACHVLCQCRGTQRYAPQENEHRRRLRDEVVRLAAKFGRYRYRRVTALVREEGFRVKHKRVERSWRQVSSARQEPAI